MSNKVTKAELTEFKINKEAVKEFSNGEITVYWKADLCIHSANCLIGLPEVFNSKKKPWVNVHASNSKEIMKVIDRCPSRALTYLKSAKFVTSKPRIKAKMKPKFARIHILKNGPALVTGNFILRDSKKKKIQIQNEVAALCRCGASKKKPFCDGSHQTAEFIG
ncbi:MAG TPA: (4Fe-4S)-binding protein [Bacteroidales bacterium]|nr:(4Fe-4S)-binding protein [Bacteroidales bacterium]HPS63123.1 (4Fe-4S)-binding protein [Bacteroidales bacterium]